MADTEVFKLNLDSEEFIEAVKKAADSLDGLGAKSDSLDAIISGIGTATKLVGTMAVAFVAAKSALEWVEEAEQIKQISAEFDTLSTQAGIATGALLEGLQKSSNGLIDNTDLMKLANKAIVEMGDNAKRLPEIMDLARKSTALFGGDLATNFGNINQAIASGNTRMLKHMGIIVDANKAYIDYAKSIGTTVDQLSQSGKQAAVMNAVIAQGGEAFKGVSTDMLQTQTAMQQISAIAKEFGEIFVTVFEKSVGPTVRSALGYIKEFGSYIKDKVIAFTGEWGENAEVTAAQIKGLEGNLSSMKEKLKDLETSGPSMWTSVFGDPEKEKAKLIQDIQNTENEIRGLKKNQADKDKAEEEKAGAAKPREQDDKTLYENRLKHATEYHKELTKLQDQALADKEKAEMSEQEVEANHAARLEQMARDTSEKIAEIKSKVAEGKLSPEEATKLEEQVQIAHNEKMIALENDLTDKKIAAMNRLSQHSKDSATQFSAGWEAASLKAQQTLNNYANLSQKAFSSLNTNAKNAFIAMGQGSKSAGEAMKGFILGSIADMAEAQGEFLLASGIGTVNPVQIAEGGALLALSGLLRAASGSSSSLGGGGGGGGGGTATAASTNTASQSSSVPSQQATQQKQVTVQVMGHVFETDQTKRVMMDLIRQETDATGFTYQQIGV